MLPCLYWMMMSYPGLYSNPSRAAEVTLNYRLGHHLAYLPGRTKVLCQLVSSFILAPAQEYWKKTGCIFSVLLIFVECWLAVKARAEGICKVSTRCIQWNLWSIKYFSVFYSWYQCLWFLQEIIRIWEGLYNTIQSCSACMQRYHRNSLASRRLFLCWLGFKVCFKNFLRSLYH